MVAWRAVLVFVFSPRLALGRKTSAAPATPAPRANRCNMPRQTFYIYRHERGAAWPPPLTLLNVSLILFKITYMKHNIMLFNIPLLHSVVACVTAMLGRPRYSFNATLVFQVLERGLKAIPLSVDLWIHYLNHIKSTRTEDHAFIRSQYERAIGM